MAYPPAGKPALFRTHPGRLPPGPASPDSMPSRRSAGKTHRKPYTPSRRTPARAGAQAAQPGAGTGRLAWLLRSEEHTSELQSLMRISYAVFCLKKKKKKRIIQLTATTKI